MNNIASHRIAEHVQISVYILRKNDLAHKSSSLIYNALRTLHLERNSRVSGPAAQEPRIQKLRPNILLISATTPHILDDLLALLEIHAPLRGDKLTQHIVHLPRHVRGITTDVKIRLLGQEVVDELGVLPHQMLYVDFLARGFTREGVEDCEVGA
jgi:hypothetical protein